MGSDVYKRQVLSYGYQVIAEAIDSYANPDLQPSEWDLGALLTSLRTLLPIPQDVTAQSLVDLASAEINTMLCELLHLVYDRKENLIEQQRPGLMRQVERFFVLQQIDLLWREHLQAMNALKESVSLRSYAQKDPLIEYKNEGYEMFLGMMDQIRANILRLMFTFQPSQQNTSKSTQPIPQEDLTTQPPPTQPQLFTF